MGRPRFRRSCRVGVVSRPDTTVWGEVLDLSEIDVRCEVPVQVRFTEALAVNGAAR